MSAAEFISLADVVRRGALAPASQREPTADGVEAQQSAGVSAAGESPLGAIDVEADDDVVRAAMRDARLFRARLADAFDEALPRLLREVAAAVVGRELRLGPCDLARLVERIGETAPVVRVRIAPGDMQHAFRVPVVADASLHDGDAIVELAHGAIDARLGVRLAVALESFG